MLAAIFTVCANNDSELINAIAEAIDDECNENYYDDITLDDYDGLNLGSSRARRTF